MLRNMKVGTKLFTVLAAPVLVLIILATVGVVQRRDESNDARRVEQLTDFVTVNAGLINQLERESLWSGAFMGTGGARYGDELAAQRAQTDVARGAFEQAVETIDPGADSPTIADAVVRAQRRLGNLKTHRITVDLGQTIPTQVISQFSSATSDLITINAQLVQVANNSELLLGLNTVANFERIMHARATTASLAVAAAARGSFTADDGERCPDVTVDCVSYTATLESIDNEAQAGRTFDANASTEAKDLKTDVAANLPVDALTQAIVDDGLESNVVTVFPDSYIKASLEAQDSFQVVETEFIASVVDHARDLTASADTAVRFYLGLTLLAIALALVVAFFVARATTVPLRKLTAAAYTLSADKLPRLVERLRSPDEDDEPLSAALTPIDISSRDEIGQLAEAFNSIQLVTVEVAEEQALLLRKGIGDIFINLARRNQTLLDRQIEFIDQLEAHEADPDQLENLFKLDHLATRMRRNAESLLVLAGAEPPRRRGRPVLLADVARVAIGEVEDFARIQLLALDDATVAGNVAVDLAHLLSELMENATHFSPPDTMVDIVGHRAGPDGYILSVSDQGIGMNVDQLAEANRQLTHPPLVGLALSRSLGFIVIGRLAQRFGVAVRLTPSPSGGVTALVTLPTELVDYPGGDRGAPLAAPAAIEVHATDVDEVEVEAPATGVDEVEVEALEVEEVEVVEMVAAEAVVSEVEVEATHASYGFGSVDEDREPFGADDPLVLGFPSLGDALLDELVDDATPADDEFERGLQSLVSDDLAPGPVEPIASDLARRDSVPGAFGTVVPSEIPPYEPLEDRRAQDPVPAAAGEPGPGPLPELEVAEAPGADPVESAVGAARPLTAAGLVRRTPRKPDASGAAATAPARVGRPVKASTRSPEEVRKMLSRYRSGLNKGRGGADSGSKTDS